MATGTERRIYTPEFKAAALQLHRAGQSLEEVSSALDVSVPLLRTWLLQAEVHYPGDPVPAPVRPAQPATGLAPSAQTPPPRNQLAKKCMVCGRGPALTVKLRSVTGIVIAFRMRRVTGTFCRDCGTAMARNTLNRTLLTGWWGLFAGIANFYAALVDANALARFRRSAEPVGEPTAPPLKTANPLFKRAGVYVGAVAVLASFVVGLSFVGTYAGPSALKGKCVAFSQTRILPKPCSEAHDGRVIDVVSNRAFCPEATDATMRLKVDDSKLLCLDLDQ
jgi:transposase-like protein